MYAIFYCVTKRFYYIGGRKFTIKTDRRNLQFWSSASASPKVERWRLALAEFDFDVSYIAGKSNGVVDAMSRLTTITTTSPDSQTRVQILETFHSGIEGHRGVRATVQRLHATGHSWPNLQQHVSTYIATCPICQKTKPAKHHSGPTFSTKATYPNQRLAVDSVGPFDPDVYGYQHVLVMEDCFTRFICLAPTISVSATVQRTVANGQNSCQRFKE